MASPHASAPHPGPPLGRRSAGGQASLEYLALLAVLAALLTSALAFSGALPPLGRSVAGAIRHGICLVSGGICTQQEAQAAGLEPCPLFRRNQQEQATVSVAIIALQRGDAMAIETRSDGTAGVSFIDGGGAGVTGGVGLRLTPIGLNASVEGVAGAMFNGGQTWEFGSAAAAEAFVRRYSSGESLGGEARELGHKLCFLCPGWLRGEGRPKLPPPDSRAIEGGVFGQAAATLEVPVGGRDSLTGPSSNASASVVLGRETSGDRTTWYLSAEGSLLQHLGPVLSSLGGARSASAAIELTSEAGRPVELRVRAAAAASDDPGFSSATLSGEDLADGLRRAVSGAPRADGRAIEAEVALDLRDPENLAAVRAFFAGGPPLPSEIAALGRRLALAASVDAREFDYRATDLNVSGEAAVGARLGAGYQRTREERRLLGAWSRLPGDRLRTREDCTSPATA